LKQELNKTFASNIAFIHSFHNSRTTEPIATEVSASQLAYEKFEYANLLNIAKMIFSHSKDQKNYRNSYKLKIPKVFLPFFSSNNYEHNQFNNLQN
jgi:hypothetical protein